MIIYPVLNLTDVRGGTGEIVPFISYSVIHLMSNRKIDDSPVDFRIALSVCLATKDLLHTGMRE